MALTPNVPFAEGDAWTPELAYAAFNSPVFDDQPQYLGHRQRIDDSELSNASGGIKSRVTQLESGFKVSPVTGLTVRYEAGTLKLLAGGTVSKPAATLVVPDNSVSYVYADRDGNITVAPTPTATRAVLAQVTASGGSVSSVQDLRHPGYIAISPALSYVKVFGGSSLVDKVVAQGEVLDQGVYYYRNFTVPAGVSCTVSKSAKIYCTDGFSVYGTINVTAQAVGAPYTPANFSNIGSTGAVPGSGAGSNGQPYPWGPQPYGSGGATGSGQALETSIIWGTLWKGGDGGGQLWVECAGAITITGTIIATGSDGGKGTTQQGTPTQGAQAGNNYSVLSGSGGGSGGLILLSCLGAVTLTPGSTLDVRGGRGGDGFVQTPPGTSSSYSALGGGGGGGGVIVIMSPQPVTTASSNILLAGGQTGVIFSNTAVSVSADSWQVTNPSIYLGGGSGGGFGGASGGYYATVNGSIHTLTRTSGGAGKLIVRDFAPIG